MKVQRQSPKTNLGADALRIAALILLLQVRRHGLHVEERLSGIDVGRDVVLEPLQNHILGEVMILVPVSERMVQGDKDGVIGFRRVQVLHDLVVLIDDMREDLGVFVSRDELIDGLVWGMMLMT